MVLLMILDTGEYLGISEHNWVKGDLFALVSWLREREISFDEIESIITEFIRGSQETITVPLSL